MTAADRRSDSADPIEGVPIQCLIEMAGDGTVTLLRSAGCTPDDAQDLCGLVVGGPRVVDLTPQRI